MATKSASASADTTLNVEGKTDKQISLSSRVKQRWQHLDSKASYWLGQWQEIAGYILPRKAYVNYTRVPGPSPDREAQLFSSHAARANATAAQGIMSLVCDVQKEWVSLSAPEGLEDEEGVSEYYARCSDIMLEEMARSNFYSEFLEVNMDRTGFGTSAFIVEEGKDESLVFEVWNVGTFRIAQNADRKVDTILVKKEMTVRQLVEKYGINNVSEKSREIYLANDGKSLDTVIDVLFEISPRSEEDRAKGKKDAQNKPIASIHIEHQAGKLLLNSGYDEQPFFCTRYLRFAADVYGWSPSWHALPDARQLNLIQKQSDSIIGIMLNPRILMPESLAGRQPDLREGGITYYDEADPQAVPKEWGTIANPDLAEKRIAELKADIDDSFNVQMFKMFSQLAQTGRELTATQVRAMDQEKITFLSTTYSLITTEVLIPLVHRVYGILSRRGLMPPPPQALIQPGRDGDAFIPEPKIIFNNALAVALEQRQTDAIDPVIQGAIAVAQVTGDFSVLDNFDMDKIARGKALASGADPDFMREVADVAKMRQQRAQAQQAAAQQQQQAHLAEVASKLGGVSQESPMAGQIQQQLQNHL
jgi:hypothetical protein